jgi:cytochrome c-type biogenesis protein CcmH
MTIPARPRGAVVVATLLLALVAGTAWGQEQALDRRVFEIANLLRCPTCVSEAVGQSSSPIAREMRVLIQEQLEMGKSQAEVLAFFQERYGDWILLEPPRRGIHLLVWLLPIVATVVGVGALTVLVRRWREQGAAPVDAAPEDVARVRALLAEGRDGDALPRRP